jgi:hypothetical protein
MKQTFMLVTYSIAFFVKILKQNQNRQRTNLLITINVSIYINLLIQLTFKQFVLEFYLNFKRLN